MCYSSPNTSAPTLPLQSSRRRSRSLIKTVTVPSPPKNSGRWCAPWGRIPPRLSFKTWLTRWMPTVRIHIDGKLETRTQFCCKCKGSVCLSTKATVPSTFPSSWPWWPGRWKTQTARRRSGKLSESSTRYGGDLPLCGIVTELVGKSQARKNLMCGCYSRCVWAQAFGRLANMLSPPVCWKFDTCR